MCVFERRSAFVLACYEGEFTSEQANAAWDVIEAAKALKKVYLYHRREDIPDHILRVCETIEALEAEEEKP